VEACELLGVPVGSRQTVLSQAYHHLARTTHPDVSEDPDAAERFMRLQAAYELASACARASLGGGTSGLDQDPVQVTRARTTSRHFASAYRRAGTTRRPMFVAGPVSVVPPTADHS
jgi:hypothetical protein